MANLYQCLNQAFRNANSLEESSFDPYESFNADYVRFVCAVEDGDIIPTAPALTRALDYWVPKREDLCLDMAIEEQAVHGLHVQCEKLASHGDEHGRRHYALELSDSKARLADLAKQKQWVDHAVELLGDALEIARAKSAPTLSEIIDFAVFNAVRDKICYPGQSFVLEAEQINTGDIVEYYPRS